MCSENYRTPLGNPAKGRGDRLETSRVVDVRRPVQRHHNGGIARDSKRFAKADPASLWKREEQAVDHDVADEHDLVIGLALASQSLDCVSRWSEEQVSQAVSHDPIDFFSFNFTKPLS